MDPFYVLGIERTASKEQIKKKYRELAKKWHPDLVKDTSREVAEQKFKAITDAYKQILDENAPTPSRSTRGGPTGPTYWSYGSRQATGPGAQPRYKTYEYVASPADASAFSQWKKLGKSDRFALLALAGFGLTLGVGLFFNSENRVSKVYESTNNAGYAVQAERISSRDLKRRQPSSNSNGGEPAAGTS